MAQAEAKYRRVILKISGEGLSAPQGFGIGSEALIRVAGEIQQVHDAGVQVAVVIGGGNILRGKIFAEQCRISETTAHYMGMLATVINALALQETLESRGIETRVLSSIPVSSVCETFVRRRCVRHLEKGRVTILAAGTGRPHVTTDTAAALAAVEVKADALFKATQVDGVYSADPKKDPNARLFEKLSYDRVINDRLEVMDISAVDLCQRNGVPIIVFNLHRPGNMKRIIEGEKIGTVVS
ncbi:MAG: UMP kinase [Planctomycetota bacterium]|nr:MAG: UMP kinase [Planctomycetota bacterium]